MGWDRYAPIPDLVLRRSFEILFSTLLSSLFMAEKEGI
jgi:hypothetical protein